MSNSSSRIKWAPSLWSLGLTDISMNSSGQYETELWQLTITSSLFEAHPNKRVFQKTMEELQ